ncbi:MAG TPA: sulfotransferase, partial [Gemmataceae bacterium]|nr:sulfotransferase [Gemmataceae bacterium]
MKAFQDPGRFFIVGCQRSGTTLLRLVLECHPLVACYDEDTAYKALQEGCRCPPPGKRLAGFKIPRWTEQLGEPVCRDEGLAETAAGLYQGEPLVFVLRDVRDVVASMHKLRMTERQTWLEFCARPILEAKLRRPEFRERYAPEIAALRACGDSPFAAGALYWKYKTQSVF